MKSEVQQTNAPEHSDEAGNPKPAPVKCQHYNNQFGTRCGKPATHRAFGWKNNPALHLCDEHAEVYRGFGNPVVVRPLNEGMEIIPDAPKTEAPAPAPAEVPDGDHTQQPDGPETTSNDEQGIPPGV